jgi:hypothetical protein
MLFLSFEDPEKGERLGMLAHQPLFDFARNRTPVLKDY